MPNLLLIESPGKLKKLGQILGSGWFAYGNPYVYSDPTGMYTINEQNINRVIQNILDSIRNEIVDNAGPALFMRTAKGVEEDA